MSFSKKLVSATACSADLLLLASSCVVCCYSLSTGRLLRVLRGHSLDVTSIFCSSGSNTTVYTGSLDGTVRVWDLLSGRCDSFVVGYEICSVVASPQGRVIWVSGQFRGAAKCMFYNTAEDRCWKTQLKLSAVAPIVSSMPGHHAAVHDKHKVLVWSTDNPAGAILTLRHTKAIVCVALSASEQVIAAGDVTGRVHLWQSYSDSLQQICQVGACSLVPSCTTLHWHSQAVASLTFNTNNTAIVTGGLEGVLVVWHLPSGARSFIPRLGGRIENVKQCQAEGSQYLVTLADGSILLVDAMDSQVVHLLYASVNTLAELAVQATACVGSSLDQLQQPSLSPVYQCTARTEATASMQKPPGHYSVPFRAQLERELIPLSGLVGPPLVSFVHGVMQASKHDVASSGRSVDGTLLTLGLRDTLICWSLVTHQPLAALPLSTVTPFGKYAKLLTSGSSLVLSAPDGMVPHPACWNMTLTVRLCSSVHACTLVFDPMSFNLAVICSGAQKDGQDGMLILFKSVLLPSQGSRTTCLAWMLQYDSCDSCCSTPLQAVAEMTLPVNRVSMLMSTCGPHSTSSRPCDALERYSFTNNKTAVDAGRDCSWATSIPAADFRVGPITHGGAFWQGSGGNDALITSMVASMLWKFLVK